VPLYLDLWMRAFDDREAPAVSGERELLEAYLADLRGRFPQFWPGMARILDHMPPPASPAASPSRSRSAPAPPPSWC
jgi:hypothetical protein